MNPSGTDTSQLSDRPEREKDTFLTARIFFSLDRCLLMGNPTAAACPASGSEEPLARREGLPPGHEPFRGGAWPGGSSGALFLTG